MTRGRSVKIGAFVAGAVLLSLAALLVFAKLRLWSDRDPYWTRFPYSVTGLDVGAPVELWGVNVGSVKSIALGRGGVRVDILIDSGVEVPRGARASLKIEGLTGIKYIDVTGGQLGGPALAAGGHIEASGRDLGQALESGIAVMYRLDAIVERVETVIGKSSFLLDNLNALTGAENRVLIADALVRVTGAAEEAQGASNELASLARAANQRVPAILESLDRAGQNAEVMSTRAISIATEIGSAARDARRTAEAMTTLAERARNDLPEVLLQIRAAALRAQTLLRSLEESPSQLLRSRPREEIPPP